jgi:hypothetical protein
MNEYFNWKLHDCPENGILVLLTSKYTAPSEGEYDTKNK